MSERETGGPAYPSNFYHEMTLRDHFAATVFDAAMRHEGFRDSFTFEQKADWTYQMADALVKRSQA